MSRLAGGADFVQFLAVLAVLPKWIWKKRLNLYYSSKLTEAKQLAWQGSEQNLSPKQIRRPLLLLPYPSFFYGRAYVDLVDIRTARKTHIRSAAARVILRVNWISNFLYQCSFLQRLFNTFFIYLLLPIDQGILCSNYLSPA